MREELIWLDDNWKITSEKRATQLIIREVNEDGTLKTETFVTLDKN